MEGQSVLSVLINLQPYSAPQQECRRPQAVDLLRTPPLADITHITHIHEGYTDGLAVSVSFFRGKGILHSVTMIVIPTPFSHTVGAPIAKAESVNPSSCFMVPLRIGQSLKPMVECISNLLQYRSKYKKIQARRENRSG